MTRRVMATAVILICAFAAAHIAFAQDAEPVTTDLLTGAPVGESVEESASDALSGDQVGEVGGSAGDVSADASAAEPVDKPAKKSAKKSADKSTGPPAEYSADEPAAKPAKKSADKLAADEAAVKEETKFKLSGLLEAGFDIHNRKDRGDTRNSVIGRGEIEISARPVKKVRAEFGIEYDVRDKFIVVDKLYGQYNITNDGTIRAGLMKKSFGLEERSGVDERYFHRRSIINGELEDLGFLGHDLTILYRHDIDSTWRFSGGLSWSLDSVGIRGSSLSPEDSMSYLHNYSVQYNPNPNMMFVLAAIVKHLNYSGSTTFASSLSFVHTANPVESEAEITLGSRKTVLSGYEDLGEWEPPRPYSYVDDNLIFGARVQERFPIELDSKVLRQVIPVVEAAAYWGDLESKDFDAQFRAGVIFGFAKNSAFQFRNGFSALMKARDGATEFTRYRWDSEVVVIF